MLFAVQAAIEVDDQESNVVNRKQHFQEIEAMPSAAADASTFLPNTGIKSGGGASVPAPAIPNIRKRGRTPADDSVGKPKSCICQ